MPGDGNRKGHKPRDATSLLSRHFIIFYLTSEITSISFS